MHAGPARSALVLALLLVPFLAGCAERRSLQVTATAYTSSPGEGQGDPNVGAWGDRIEPGVRALAVSRDLLELGLTRGTRVWIEGLPGTWVVLDKMHRRWRRKIDIYMGTARERAREWGRRPVTIHWRASDAGDGG